MLGPLNFAASFLRDSTAGQLPSILQLQLHTEEHFQNPCLTFWIPYSTVVLCHFVHSSNLPYFLSFIYFLKFSYSISIHLKSQAWILKVSPHRNLLENFKDYVFLIEPIMPSGVTHKLMNPPKNHLIVREPGTQKWAIGTKRGH